MSERQQVIVVGGGISGLAAAKVLREHGIKALVLEANNRVGGRTQTIQNKDCGYTDLGGAYVGVTQNKLLRIAREYGIKTYMINVKEALVHYWKGQTNRFYTEYPPMPGLLATMDCNNLFRTMDEMCNQIPIEAPWKAPKALEWDQMNVKEFLDKICWTQSTREFADKWVNVNVTSEPYEISLLWLLWYVARCGGTMRIFACTNGGQERKFIGGMQQVSNSIAEDLGVGERVLLNRPVTQIQNDNTGVVVTTTNGDHFEGDYVIMAMAPPLQMKITYDPPLPILRNQLMQRMPMGSVIKTMTYYDRPYWREHGMAGLSAIVDDEQIIGFTIDDCKPDGTYPCLMGFILADKTPRYGKLTKEERKQAIAKCYAKVFGVKELETPVHYEEKNWQEEQWAGGCYTCMMPPGFLTKYGKVLRQPVHRMYFAGTETADRWSGYIEGGIEAGERAAREILFDMGKIRKDEIWREDPPDPEVIARPFNMSFWERNLPSVPGFMKLIGAMGVASGVGAGAYAFTSKL